jgi:hypothetical protein
MPQLFTAEDRYQSQTGPHDVCEGRKDNGLNFFSGSLGFPASIPSKLHIRAYTHSARCGLWFRERPLVHRDAGSPLREYEYKTPTFT